MQKVGSVPEKIHLKFVELAKLIARLMFDCVMHTTPSVANLIDILRLTACVFIVWPP